MALSASLVIALFLLPPFAAFLFKKSNLKVSFKLAGNILLALVGLSGLFFFHWLGLVLVGFSITGLLSAEEVLSKKSSNLLNIAISCLAIVLLLAEYWRPLGFDRSIGMNLIFVSIICFGILGIFSVFRRFYESILKWALENKLLFSVIPLTVLVCGVLIYRNTGKEFMPSLSEGTFLLMPTSLPHAGVEENKRVLQQLDMAVATIPEIETVVGKAGRTESALDPAPLSMYENIIQYKAEYMHNSKGRKQRYRMNDDGLFQLKNGKSTRNPNNPTETETENSFKRPRLNRKR